MSETLLVRDARPVAGHAETTGLYAHESRMDRGELRSIKVKLPVSYHIKLHSLRLYRCESISETVTSALHLYFQAMEEERRAERAQAST